MASGNSPRRRSHCSSGPSRWLRAPTPGGAQIQLSVEGMTCSGCARKVADCLRAVPGVRSVDVQLDSGRAEVQWKPSVSPDEEGLVDAVTKAGFKAHLAASVTSPGEVSLVPVGRVAVQCCRRLSPHRAAVHSGVGIWGGDGALVPLAGFFPGVTRPGSFAALGSTAARGIS